MKLLFRLTLFALITFTCSCAMIFNKKNVDVSINSNPSGADIFIEGKNYGKTPATINIQPKNYTVVLTKEGHGSTQLKLESWVAARNGNCMADALGAMLIVPLYSMYWSGYCDDFKEKDNFVNIPRNASSVSTNRSNIEFETNAAAETTNYNYNQDDYYKGARTKYRR
jgi:hypothetical protein